MPLVANRWRLAYFLILAGATAACASHLKYAGPLATLPDPSPQVSLPILDPLLKPELSVFGTVSGPSGASAGLWFTVDSGWTALNVPQPIAQRLELRELGRGRVVTAVGASADEPVLLAPRVTFEKLAASDVLVGTVDHLAVLGQAILRHSPWEVSWTRGTLTLGALPWTEGGDVLGVWLHPDRQHQADQVEVLINGHPTRLLLDTGASLSALPAAVGAALGLPARPFKGTLSSAGGAASIDHVVEGQLRLGALDLGLTAFAALPNGGSQALLGLDILSRFDFQVIPGVRLLLRPRGELRATARERAARWPWLPTACAHVGCIRARVTASGQHGQLEIERERRLPVAAAWVLGCAEPEHVAPSSPMAQRLTQRGLRLPFERIVLRLSPAAPTIVTTELAFASRLWFRPDGTGCKDLEVLDVLAIPSGQAIAGGAEARISP